MTSVLSCLHLSATPDPTSTSLVSRTLPISLQYTQSTLYNQYLHKHQPNAHLQIEINSPHIPRNTNSPPTPPPPLPARRPSNQHRNNPKNNTNPRHQIPLPDLHSPPHPRTRGPRQPTPQCSPLHRARETMAEHEPRNLRRGRCTGARIATGLVVAEVDS